MSGNRSKDTMLATAADGEWGNSLNQLAEWDVQALESMGADLAAEAGRIWYDG